MAGRSVYERFGKSSLTGTVQSGRRHTVKGNDTPQSVAAKYYPDEGYSSEAWRQIAEAAGIDDLEGDIVPGDVWVIPTLKPVE